MTRPARCLLAVVASFPALAFLNQPSDPNVVWTQPLRAEPKAVWSVADLKYLLVRESNGLSLFDSRDGKVVWTEPTPEAIEDPSFFAGADLYVQNGRKESLIVHAASRRVAVVPSRLLFPALVGAGDAVLGWATPSTLALHSATDGSRRWAVTIRSKVKRMIRYAMVTGLSDSPGALTCLIFAQSEAEDCAILALVDLASGSLLWDLVIQDAGESSGPPFSMDSAHVVTAGSHIFVESNGLAKIDGRNGRIVWRTPYNTGEARRLRAGHVTLLNSNAVPLVTDEAVYTAAKGSVRRLDPATGRVMWKSQDYDLTPHLALHGDTVAATTGGVFRGISTRVTVGQFFAALAMGMVTGPTTGVVVIPRGSSTTSDPSRLDAIENVTVERIDDSHHRNGQPGVVLLDRSTGVETKRLTGGPFVSGTGLLRANPYYADSGGVFLCEPPEWRPRAIAGGSLGSPAQTLSSFALRDDRHGLLVSFPPGKGAPSLQKVDLESGKVLWTSSPFENQERPGFRFMARDPKKGGAPELLAIGPELVFFIQKQSLYAIDDSSGALMWAAKVGDGKWSVYPSQQAAVWFDRGKRELRFWRAGKPPAN